MKQVPVQVLQPAGKNRPARRGLWSCLLAALLLLGSLLALQATWGTGAPSLWPALLAGCLGLGSAAVAWLLRPRSALAGFVWVLPWPVLALFTGIAAPWAGAKGWLNAIITRWNQLHDGGVLLFTGSGAGSAALAFALWMALLFGQLVWLMASRRRSGFAALWCLVWLALQMLGESTSLPACALLLAGVVGIAVAPAGCRLLPAAIHATAAMTALLCLAAAVLPLGDLPQIRTLREDTRQGIKELRYGRDTLPEGDLAKADTLHAAGDEAMLTVTTQQEKTLYLRAYTGGTYKDGCWQPLPDSAYSGDYAGLLNWLLGQGFTPFTQLAAYYALCPDPPEENTLTVQTDHASRLYLYLPDGITAEGRAWPWQDAVLYSRGLRGQRQYTVTEVSDYRPAELTVAADWLTDPETEAQQQYAAAEAAYRDFVYDRYTAVDTDTYQLMQRLFWQDYDAESDGIYSAITRVRTVLRDTVTLSDTAAPAPEGVDPVQYFLTTSRQGNAMLYASTAVQALRAHGIPARYAEGYCLPADRTAPGTVTLTGRDAHAWAEVYFDGIGWLPLDVTPGYYYEAVALQQMVSLPNAVHKTAALQENNTDAAQITATSGEDGSSAVLPEALRRTSLALLGLAALALLALAVVLATLEAYRAVRIRMVENAYRKAAPARRAEMLEHQLFALLRAEGIDTTLGYDTARVDAQVAAHFEKVRPGEFARATALLEKAVYGGAAPDAREERALSTFVWKLIRSRPRHNLLQQWKRRYRPL